MFKPSNAHIMILAAVFLLVTVESAVRAPTNFAAHNLVGQRRYASAYSSGSGYTSGYSSGGTPAPTAAPTAATKVTIVQTATLSLASAADYTGDLKLVAEVAMGIVYQTYDKTKKVWFTGCGMTSKVVSRRASVKVQFTATVSASKSASAQSQATSLAGNTALLTTAFAEAKTATGKTAVTVPTVSSISTAAVTKETTFSGVSSSSNVCMVTIALFASAVAMFQKH
jgi:hypothetical protein